MFFGGGLFGLIVLGFWIWAIFDVISTDESSVRNLPKMVWLLLVIFLSSVGALAWLVLGRPEHAGLRPGAGASGLGPSAPTTPGSPRRPLAVEDSPAWTDEDARRARYAELDAELDRRLEEKRRRLEAGTAEEEAAD